MERIYVERLSNGTIFKLVAIGSVFSIVPITFFFGILSLFGLNALSWNDRPVVGVKAFIVSPLIGLFFAGFATAFGGGAVTLGLWVYSFFGQIKIDYEAIAAESGSSTYS
jgi:hypothetical protein